MIAPRPSSAQRSWHAPIARAIPALVVGLLITFTADHSAAFGLGMAAVFGITTGIALSTVGLRLSRDDPARSLLLGLALVAGAMGLGALVTGSGPLPMLLLLLGGYAVLAGAHELVWGIRHRRTSVYSRDAMTVGAATLALAVLLTLVSDPVTAVGLFGAYAVLLGVFLVIVGLSAPSSARSSTPPKEHGSS
jgi:hypothetical protein